MAAWVCRYCGHVYDESLGAPADGVAPGTHFADLTESWDCPDCGAQKTDFTRRDS